MPLSAVDPAHYEQLLTRKAEAVSTLLAPYSPPTPQVFPSANLGFRMRAEFRVWHDGDRLDYVMFRPGQAKDPVIIQSFPIACERIQQLMPALMDELRVEPGLRRKLFQVEFLSSLAGDTLVTLAYHRRLDEQWQALAESLGSRLGVSIVGRSRKQKLVVGRDFVQEVLPIAGHDYRYRQHEQAFTQPNAMLNVRMVEWACERARSLEGDLLELYCGNGNFTLPLARHFDQVIATELAKTSIRAARQNVADNHCGNIHIIRLSAQEVVQAMAGEREFRRLAELPKALGEYRLQTVFVDPPRAGLDPQTVTMVASFPAIIYISCNPRTLAENLEILCRTHRIENFALFDQFPYTDHMECGVFLRRIRES